MADVRRGKAFSPSHITAFFQIFPNGSTGAGFNTTDGAVSTAALSADGAASCRVRINDSEESAPVSRRVIDAYRRNRQTAPLLGNDSVDVQHRIFSPIGFGLGMSGAGAFSLSLALNQALANPLSYREAMEIARQAEIESGTGLGDVVGQQYSGLMLGLPPYPSMNAAAISGAPSHVVCAYFAPIETARIIRDAEWKASINAVGAECMEHIQNDPTYANFITLARMFTFRTNLCSPELMALLEAVPDASMAMLGQTAFLLTDDVHDGVRRLSRFTNNLSVCSLTAFGATEIRDSETAA